MTLTLIQEQMRRFYIMGALKILGIDITQIGVRDDVGGIGGSNIPYFKFNSVLEIASKEDIKVFKGGVNIFLDPHASDVPLSGRDVLDNFIVIFDKPKNYIFLLDEEESYITRHK